jgi:hypothetical protein
MLEDLRTSHLTQRRSTRASHALTLGCVALAGSLLMVVAEGRDPDGSRAGGLRPLATLDGPLFHERGRSGDAQGPARPADNRGRSHETNGSVLEHLAGTALAVVLPPQGGRDHASPAR